MTGNQITITPEVRQTGNRGHFSPPLLPALPKNRTLRFGLLALCFVAATAGAPAGRRLVSAPIRNGLHKAAAAIACPVPAKVPLEKSMILIGGL